MRFHYFVLKLTFNQRVVGSNPTAVTKHINSLIVTEKSQICAGYLSGYLFGHRSASPSADPVAQPAFLARAQPSRPAIGFAFRITALDLLLRVSHTGIPFVA